MSLVRNKRGAVAVTRSGECLTIHVCEPEGGRWHGIVSRLPGDARDALLTQLGSRVCERLGLS